MIGIGVELAAQAGDLGGVAGGNITAATFLHRFTDYPWVHLDIAGTAYSDKAGPYCPVGATGEGARLLVQFVRDWEAKKS